MVLVRVAVLLLLVASTGCVRRVAVVPPAAAGAPSEPVPPGQVEVNVVADDDSPPWTVDDGGGTCSTPCTRRVSPSTRLFLTSRAGDETSVSAREVEALGAQRALLVAEGSHQGLLVNGMVFTTLGGMGVVVATTLAAVGCSRADKAGMCTAGLVTGAVTIPLTAVSIWMIVAAAPRVHVIPVLTAELARGSPPLQLALTPAGVFGTF